jgi:hypothetical protein
MKAEHRKELQTNLLADRMGRMVQRAKSGPSRRTVLWIVLAVVAVIVYVGFSIYRSNQRAIVSTNWMNLGEEYITSANAKGMVTQNPWVVEYRDTNPGLAARYQFAWVRLWDQGLKHLIGNPARALINIKESEKEFVVLSEDCKDDPILAPEAAYALAVIEESKTVEDRASLDKAIGRYKGVASKYKDSAAGKAAAQRADYLVKNRASVEDFYMFMNQHSMPVAPGMLPIEPPPVPKKEPEKK